MRPHRRQPTRLPRPWDSPGKNTGVGCHFLLQGMKVKNESEVALSHPDPVCVCVCACAHARVLSHVQLFVTPWTIAHQAPLSVEFSRQECWSGLLFPSLGDLPDPGIEPASAALADGKSVV